MNFATPGLAAIAAAVAVPSLIILYFLKLRRKDVEVSTTLLWKKAIQDLQANAPFQKLRRNLLLFLQLLMLAAALFALAQPQSRIDTQAAARHVIMIDRSASMNAIDGDPTGVYDAPGMTRLEAAKRRAIAEIEGLREPSAWDREATGDQAMVIAFDAAAAEIVERFTGDKALLIAAINRIEATDTPGAIGEAFRLAQAHRARRTLLDDAGGTQDAEPIEIEGQVAGPPQTFHLFTDGRVPDLNQFLPAETDPVYYHRIGRDDAVNLAITGLRAERAYDKPERLTIFVGIQSNARAARSVDVELLLDGTPAAIRAVTLPASEVDAAVEAADEGGTARAASARPGTGGVVFELERTAGAIATVRLRTGDVAERAQDAQADVLPTDDVGYLVVPPARQSAVLVVTGGNFFLAEALAGLPLADLKTVSPSAYDAMPPEERARFDVTILDGVLPAETPPGRPLPEGRFLIFNAVPPSAEGLTSRGEVGDSRFIDWTRGHPVLRAVSLDPVRITRMLKLEPGADAAADVLAETSNGPGIIELTTTESRALVVPFNLADSTWPFDVGFVVFLASSIDYLGSDASERLAGGGTRHPAPGSVYADRLPRDAASVFITPPSGGNQRLEPGPDGRIAYGPVRRTGVYQLEWSGPAGPSDVRAGDRTRRFFAVSLLDAQESDAAPAPAAELADQVVQPRGDAAAGATRNYWPWLVIAALAVLMLEWFIYNRKTYV